MLKSTDPMASAPACTAVDKLLGVIRDAGLKDLPLVTLACRALYNLCLPASLPVEMAAKNAGRNTRGCIPDSPKACAGGCIGGKGLVGRNGGYYELSSGRSGIHSRACRRRQITVPIPPRLLGSLIGTLDELESVASDIVEEAEEDEDEGPRSDYEEEERLLRIGGMRSSLCLWCGRFWPLWRSDLRLQHRMDRAAVRSGGITEQACATVPPATRESSTRAHTTI